MSTRCGAASGYADAPRSASPCCNQNATKGSRRRSQSRPPPGRSHVGVNLGIDARIVSVSERTMISR
ncbi:MAG: hypothetical protein U0326_24010 [Polyangiales bacterium]